MHRIVMIMIIAMGCFSVASATPPWRPPLARGPFTSPTGAFAVKSDPQGKVYVVYRTSTPNDKESMLSRR